MKALLVSTIAIAILLCVSLDVSAQVTIRQKYRFDFSRIETITSDSNGIGVMIGRVIASQDRINPREARSLCLSQDSTAYLSFTKEDTWSIDGHDYHYVYIVPVGSSKSDEVFEYVLAPEVYLLIIENHGSYRETNRSENVASSDD